MSVGRRLLCTILAAPLSLIFVAGCGSRETAPTQGTLALRPNIVFILADDMGPGELGSAGQTKISTPELDKMAAEGVRFTQAYAGNTLCVPSRCALMTGLHTGHSRNRSNRQDLPLRPTDFTIGEMLKQVGYSTGAVGKWALGTYGSTGYPTKKGFDFFYGVMTNVDAHNYYPDYVYRNDAKEATGNVLLKKNVSKVKVAYLPDLITKEALGFIDRAKSAGKSFFLYLPYTLPHVNNEQVPNLQNEIPSLGIYKDKPWTIPNKGHAAMITYLDKMIGVVRDKLREDGFENNTLVIFTSDNGPMIEGGVDPIFFNAAGGLRGHKRDLYEGGLRVPLLAVWPTHIPPGYVDNTPTAGWDFLPTFAELCGYKNPIQTDGVSLAGDLLSHKPLASRPPMFWVCYEWGYKQALRDGDWKAIWFNWRDRLELYNLAADPQEQHDLAASNPQMALKMRALLKSNWIPSADDAPDKASLGEPGKPPPPNQSKTPVGQE